MSRDGRAERTEARLSRRATFGPTDRMAMDCGARGSATWSFAGCARTACPSARCASSTHASREQRCWLRRGASRERMCWPRRGAPQGGESERCPEHTRGPPYVSVAHHRDPRAWRLACGTTRLKASSQSRDEPPPWLHGCCCEECSATQREATDSREDCAPTLVPRLAVCGPWSTLVVATRGVSRGGPAAAPKLRLERALAWSADGEVLRLPALPLPGGLLPTYFVCQVREFRVLWRGEFYSEARDGHGSVLARLSAIYSGGRRRKLPPLLGRRVDQRHVVRRVHLRGHVRLQAPLAHEVPRVELSAKVLLEALVDHSNRHVQRDLPAHQRKSLGRTSGSH